MASRKKPGTQPVDDWEDVPIASPADDWEDVPVLTVENGQLLNNPALQMDPETIENLRQAKLAQQYGGLESLGHAFRKGGVLGFDEELGGAAQAQQQFTNSLWNHILPGSMQLPVAQDENGQPIPALDVYRQGRDGNKLVEASARGAHPDLYRTGEIAGGLVLPLPGGAGKTLAGAVKTGAGIGAVAGLGDSEADLTKGEFGQAALDTVLGGTFGAGGGALGYGAAKLGPALMRLLRLKLEGGAVGMGRRVLNGGADLASATKKPLADDAVREALKRGAIVPGGTAKGAFNRLELDTKGLGNAYADIVARLEKLGITGPDAAKLAAELQAEGTALASNTMNNAVPRLYESTAENVMEKAGGKNLGLTQAENLKRSLQGMAKGNYANLATKELGDAQMDVASRMRQAVEDTIEQQTANAGPEAQQLASEFQPVKQTLGNLIAARESARKGMSKAAQRKPLGLTDVMLAAGQLAHGGTEPMNLAKTAGVALVSKLLRERGPSTAASLAYGGSRAAKALAASPLTSRALLQGTLGGERTGDEKQRQALADWLMEQDQVSDEQLQQQALVEELRKRPAR
jgi:hypothetical protein